MKRSAVALAVALLLTSCGTRLDGVESGAGTTGRADARPVEPAIAYVMVGSDATARGDRPAFVRLPGSAPTALGTGYLLAAAGEDVLLLLRFDGHIQAFRAGARPALLTDRMAQGSRPSGLMVGDVLYELQYPGIVSTDATGLTRNVPIPPARPSGDVTFCAMNKGMVDPVASMARAMATVGGHLYAFVATYANGAVVDLSDGRRLDLLESGPAIAMTTGSDGKLYALTIDQRCHTNTLLVRRIDPVTMHEEAVIDTHRRLGFDNVELIAGKVGPTYVHAVTESGAELLSIDSSGVTAIALPPDSGLLGAAAPDGSIYLFGGRARNVVTRFDPSTASVSVVDRARGPDGSYIQAVLFLDEASRP